MVFKNMKLNLFKVYGKYIEKSSDLLGLHEYSKALTSCWSANDLQSGSLVIMTKFITKMRNVVSDLEKEIGL